MKQKNTSAKIRIRNDRCNTSKPELTLIRVGQHLWAFYKRERRKAGNVTERRALYAALEQVWERNFQAGNGKALNLDNLARRVITLGLSRCEICRKHEEEHKPEGHEF